MGLNLWGALGPLATLGIIVLAFLIILKPIWKVFFPKDQNNKDDDD